MSERGWMVTMLAWMALSLGFLAYQVSLVSVQVANSQASLDRITALVEHLIKLH